ncbi:hypothetical protein P7K49_035932, partial [Saguinus oedipus]
LRGPVAPHAASCAGLRRAPAPAAAGPRGHRLPREPQLGRPTLPCGILAYVTGFQSC